MRKGFTLAEVLITLGIIGVVAAITIPGLITAYKKHVIASSLKRAVSSINQAIKQSESENGEMETWNKSLEQEEFIKLYIRPYMNIALTCKNITTCGYKQNKAWKNLNGQYNTYYEPTAYKRVPFITMDGILYAFANNTFSTTIADNDKIILIDINGPKPPNMHGQDVFLLYRKEAEDSIVPYGAGLPLSDIKASCNKNNLGLYCAAWIYQNGWNIPSGYPLR